MKLMFSFRSLLLGCLIIASIVVYAGNANLPNPYEISQITETVTDTLPPVEEREGDFINNPNNNPFDLNDPKVVEQEVEYDPETGLYLITEKIGDDYYRNPTYMTFEEYTEWSANKQRQDYFKQVSRVSRGGGINANDPIAKYNLDDKLICRLFGGCDVKIRPQGSIDVTFGVDFQNIENPILPERQRKTGGFDFGMNIQMNVVGSIGSKLQLSTNYNTQAGFSFDNQMNLGYEGEEDDIIRKIEAGNVSLPLRSSLIQGSQSLFGLKTELQFGRMTLTTVLSQQRSQRNEINIQGGTQLQNFEVSADEYDANRHFFLSHFNREDYERAQRNLPVINTLFKINKLEVWVTNTRNTTEGTRDIVALADLGESNRFNNSNTVPANPPTDVNGRRLPTNNANTLYQNLENNPNVRFLDNAVSELSTTYGLEQGRDFQQVRARKLSASEFTYNADLGFISINQTLQPDEVLGVAYEYTYNGKLYQVGEFAQDIPSNPDTLSVLYLKMLKSTTPRIDLPMWDLMMKNIYALGAYQIGREDFKLDVFYRNPGGGLLRHIPEGEIAGRPLISVLNLDNLNSQNDPQPDGVFDFVEGVTINTRNGRMTFPVLEPFGSSLSSQFTDPDLAGRYTYQQLYDSTLFVAREFPEFNRYVIKGTYKSSVSSEISLGAFNIPKGSVTVTAGGRQLVEGQDFTIDYNLGRIKILNDGILNSGQSIRVSFEDNTLFSVQSKTLIGTRAEYKFSDKFNIGATFMRLTERPLTEKVNIGDDPISNNIYGADVQYSTDAPWLTRAIDRLPIVKTKAKSSISFTGEVAYLDPGASRGIRENGEATVYIDDFEGSTSRIDLRAPALAWNLASVPQNDNNNNNPLFPESALINDLNYGKNRARLAWYRIDQTLRRNRSDLGPYERLITQQELFPNRVNQDLINTTIQSFDLTYYPNERGPYNYETKDGSVVSAGTDFFGKLEAPETRWAGITRQLNQNDFEATNIEYIEFWMMSPYLDENATEEGEGGDLYINLGNISEDVLRDSRRFFENGLPRPDSETITDTTAWGRIPRTQAITYAFDNDPDVRVLQDVGLDGLNDESERTIFDEFLTTLNGTIDPAVYEEIQNDPSGDNFVYYNDGQYDENTPLIDRYKVYNNSEANSRPSDGSSTVTTAGTNQPDTEDINRDNSLSQEESYFQYRIPLRRSGSRLEPNQFIVDTVETSDATWYQFKVPIEQWTDKVGSIQDFRSIRFMRMYMTGFKEQVTLRFGRLELVRNQWRRYSRQITRPGSDEPIQSIDETTFDVNTVNFEENGGRLPFPYVLPPGIRREQSLGPNPNGLQNEQSLSMRICNLGIGDERGVFKNINLDIRRFKNLKMFVHGESEDQLEKGDLRVYIRLGSDFIENYYEYSLPLQMSEEMGLVGDNDVREEVWRSENNFDIDLEKLIAAKVQKTTSGQQSITVDDPDHEGAQITVVGNPDIGLVKSILLGVYNDPSVGKSLATNCVEVWTNELRLGGINDNGGAAGLARLDIQLADLGNVSASTNFSGIGYGAIDQKINERSKEKVVQYDVSTNLELGKFLPEKSGIKIPFYAQWSKTIKTPEFDPYTLDIPLQELLDGENDGNRRDSLKKQAQDYTSIKSFNFTNVRKTRTNSKRKPMPWDIENISLTYAYSQIFKRDPTIENNTVTDHRGALTYDYSRQVKYYTPFKKAIKRKAFKIIKDITINPFPNSFGFNTNLNRRFGEKTFRFSEGENATWFEKRFTWDRNYNVQWNLTRNLNFGFTANNQAIVDEPEGRLDDKVKRDSLWSNFWDGGRTKNYSHNLNASYTLPFKSIPILDWIKVRAQYGATYSWSAATLNNRGADTGDDLDFGNVIQNSQNYQGSADLDFVRFYNKSKYLKKINTRRRPPSKFKGKDKKAVDKKGDAKGKDPKSKKKKNNEPSTMARVLLRPLMMIRKGKFNFSEKYSLVLPGYTEQTRFFGADNINSPGWKFLVGAQPPSLTEWLDNNQGFVTNNILLNQQVQQTYNQTISANLNLEPIPNLRVDLELNRSLTNSYTEYFKDTTANIDDPLVHLNQRNVGSLNLSFFTLRTLFRGRSVEDLAGVFKEFEANRLQISKEFGEEHNITALDSLGYTQGYGRYQQDVLIPAFLAAYTGRDLNSFKDLVEVGRRGRIKSGKGGIRGNGLMPIPNWKLMYNGLSKIKGLDKIFKSVNITHGYKSKLTVNSFQTDLQYQNNDPLNDDNRNDITGNFFSEFEIPDIVITEQFAPLIGIDIRFKNDLTARFDWKKSRRLAMNFIDYQLSETKTTEFTIGVGYKVTGLSLPFNIKLGKNKVTKLENDLNFKFDFSFRDDITINHLLDQNVSTPTRGTKTIRFSPSIDYAVTKELNVRIFFDRNRSIPATSASFPITNTAGGVTIRFQLSPQ